ncbi:MAG: CHAP domain-containing protein [Microthrixaceae bacterium]
MAVLVTVVAGLGGVANPAQASQSNTRVDPGGTVELSGGSWLGGAGVDVFSNGNSSTNGYGSSYGTNVNGSSVFLGEKYQCVELINRLYVARGWTTSTWYGNGNTMYANAPASLAKQPQGSITHLNPGDVISLSYGDFGHAAVVNSVSGSTVQIVNQNTQAVFSSATFSSGSLTMSGWPGYSVIGVVHRPSPPPRRAIVTAMARLTLKTHVPTNPDRHPTGAAHWRRDLIGSRRCIRAVRWR